MREHLKHLDKPQLLEISAQLIRYILQEIDGCGRRDLMKVTGLSAPAISSMSTKKNCTSGENVVRKAILALTAHYQIGYDASSGAFFGGNDPEAGMIEKMRPGFFSSRMGNRWKVIVHIKYWNRAETDIGIRYLKIHPTNKAEFYVGTKRHADYAGTVHFDRYGKHLIAELFTTDDSKKEVNLRLLIGHKGAQPELVEGFMMHSCMDDNSMVNYCIIAQNVSRSDELMMPQVMPFKDFQLQEPVIAEFFRIRNTAIHVHSAVYSLEDLDEVNISRNNDLTRMAQEQAERSRPET
jgi:hypothetical protein